MEGNVCDICGKGFETANQLRGHMMSHKREENKEERDNKARRVDRSRRVPLGTPRAKLFVDQKEGKVRRWVNDKPGRLYAAQQGGYEFVEDAVHVGEDVESGDSDMGSRVSRVVGTNDDGSPMRAYLMEIDKDLYDEDQAEKQKEVDRIDEAIRTGSVENKTGQHGYSEIKYEPK